MSVMSASQAAHQATAAGRAAPLRLTRRGRVVLAALAAVLAVIVLTLLSAGQAGGAQVSGGRPAARAGYRNLTQVVVQPGQTLWSIASTAEPAADPRLVIQQIIAANALGGSSIRAGQLLWVPKG
jgi:LysM domain-containing protein